MSENLTLPTGLITLDQMSVLSKLAKFTLSNTHLAFDFDRTMTTRNEGSRDDVTTWSILAEHLPEEGRAQHQAYFERYRTLEISQKMTEADAIEWWSSILNLFVEHGINLSAVEDDFLNKANARPGVADVFKFCADHSIPTVVLSAGILDVIEIWCEKYGVNPSLILSTALIVDEFGTVVGWNKASLVHVLNKSEAQHAELETIRADRPNTILIGDSLDDASMVSGQDSVLRIRILDQRDDELRTQEAERSISFTKFDAVICSGDLQPLLKLLNVIPQ